SKYAGITELNYKILHQLIDKILVSKAEKVDGEYVQKIQIKFVGICRDKIKTIKVNKAVSKAKQKMSDEELHEFTQRFGSGKIEFKNGDITVVSDINIDLLRKNIDKFDMVKVTDIMIMTWKKCLKNLNILYSNISMTSTYFV
ncbi:hypothetical protein OBE_01693, partial [human gut metagenome]